MCYIQFHLAFFSTQSYTDSNLFVQVFHYRIYASFSIYHRAWYILVLFEQVPKQISRLATKHPISSGLFKFESIKPILIGISLEIFLIFSIIKHCERSKKILNGYIEISWYQPNHQPSHDWGSYNTHTLTIFSLKISLFSIFRSINCSLVIHFMQTSRA